MSATLLFVSTMLASSAHARVLIAGFEVGGVDPLWGARTERAIVDALEGYHATSKSCAPKPDCVRPLARSAGADFAVHGRIDADDRGVLLTVHILEVNAGRRFASRVVFVERLEDVPLVARDVTLAFLTDPTSGITPHIMSGSLVVIGGALAFGIGLAGALWVKAVHDDPSSTPVQRAEATSLDMPLALVGGAGIFAVLVGAGIILGGEHFTEQRARF